MALDPNRWVKLLIPVADLDILVRYLEGDTDYEVLEKIEPITEGLKDWLEFKKRAAEEEIRDANS